MRIGDNDIYLSIERRDPADVYSSFLVTAQTSTGSGWEFKATHATVMLDTSDTTKKALSDFQALKIHSVEIPASEGGWLRLARDPHGQISVRYRLVRSKLRAAIEGEVFVGGEFADRFSADLHRLFWGHP